MSVSESVLGWHDFYVTAGAAAATLVGLLFVGLSLHIRVVVSHPDVRSLARVTLTAFFVILLVALAMLQSQPSAATLADWMIATGLASLALTLRPLVDVLTQRNPRTIGLRLLLARFGVSTLAFLGVGAVGVLFAAGNYDAALNGLVPLVVLLLVIAVRNTWDLLVTVADKSEAPSQQ